MEVWNTTKLSFGFEINDEIESQIMANIWGKIYMESKKPGFKNMFTKEEKEFIQAVSIQWFGEEDKTKSTIIGSDLTHHNVK